jgi:CIC family chloride channel protein
MAVSFRPVEWIRSLKTHHSFDIALAGRWAVNFIAIGIIAGLGSIIFHYLCQLGIHYFMDFMAGYRPPAPAGEHHLLPPTTQEPNRWFLLFLPAMGGLVSGWLVYTFAPRPKAMERTRPSVPTITKAALFEDGYLSSRPWHPPLP